PLPMATNPFGYTLRRSSMVRTCALLSSRSQAMGVAVGSDVGSTYAVCSVLAYDEHIMQTEVAGKTFDVVIVGSGASGGWAAKRLTEAGLRVVVLEAGRALKDTDYKEHVAAFQLPYRGRTKRPLERERPKQSASYAVREWNADWYVNDFEEPYVDTS